MKLNDRIVRRGHLRIAAKVFSYIPPIGPAEYPGSYQELGRIQFMVRIHNPKVLDVKGST
jgi:hypothetical protein